MLRASYSLILTGAFLALAAGCASTDVVAPSSDENARRLTLNVSAPEAFGFGGESRAPSGYNLRLVAALYHVDNNEPASMPIQTLEAIYNPAGSMLSFEIEEQGTYIVTVFADYIPLNSVKDNTGHYPDTYYDTTDPGIVKVKTENTNFFNTDSRDCFAGKIVFTKGSSSLSRDLTLKRPVSRIVVAAPGDAVEQLVSRVEISRCNYFGSYSFTLDEGIICGGLTTTQGGLSPVVYEVTPSGVNSTLEPEGKQLFFFYTFAGTGVDSERPSLGEICFSLTPKENIILSNSSKTIATGLIKPAPNYQVTVKGAPGWIDAATGPDDITVTLNVPSEWDEVENVN